MSKLPAVGTRAVHKDDHTNQRGPVWEVKANTAVGPSETDQIVSLAPANHKLNTTPVEPKRVPLKEFQDDYKEL